MRYIGIGMAVAISLFLLGATTASASEWNMTLEATSQLTDGNVTFGISPSATDDAEGGTDVIAILPGDPESSWTHMAFLGAGGTWRRWINKDNTTWALKVTINKMASTTISWTPADLQDNLDITINDTDMRYASSIVLSGNATGSVTHNLTILAATNTTPPAPTSLSYAVNGDWVNFTWSAGSGGPGATDGYNVSLNESWGSYNGTATSLNANVGAGNWANITVQAYNATGNGNMSAVVSADVLATTTTPPAPTLSSTTGNYWVHHSWTAGSGADTDSYNVCLNGAWTNGTATTFKNTSVGSGGWANITVWAYNATGSGNLSSSGASADVQAPTAPNITSWAPSSSVTDSEGATRAFNVTVDQNATVTWKIGGTVVETDADTKTPSYTNTSAQPGTWSVSAVATNANGTDTQTWTWTVIANGSISGTVTAGSSTGAAVCGATVYAMNTSTGATIATAETGGDGKYLIESIVRGTYTLNVSATGYVWNNATTAVVSAGTANTSCNVILTAEKVTLALQSGETASKIAVAGNETIFNLTATNYGTNATIVVTNSTKPGVNVTVNGATSTGAAISIGLLNDSESKNFNVTVVHADIGIYQVTITVANTTYGKSASIDLVACMKNATGVTEIGSCNTTDGTVTGNDTILENSNVTSNASVDNSTLSNTNVTQNATVEDSTVLDSSVTGSSSSVVNDAVVNCSTVDNSTVDNTTATESHLYEGTRVEGSTITDVTANDTEIIGSTVVNVTANGSTITGVTIDTGHAVTLVGATVVDSGGSAQITGGEIVTRGVNFSNVYMAALITDLIIDQIADTNIPANTSTSMGDIGTVGCNLTVNLTSAGTVNISETAINPDGEGSDVSNSAVIGNFLCIQCNNTSLVQNVTIRMYYTTATSYSGGVYIYHYNTATSKWEQLTTTASGTLGGMNWIEAEPNHLSTFAVMGTTKKVTTTTTSSGGGGGTYYTPTPTPTATPTATATPAATATAVRTAKPAATKKPAAATTPAAGDDATPAKPEKKGLLPGFEGVFAIAGLLAIAYVMVRRKR